MAVITPVVSIEVDKIVLDYLRTNQYGDKLSTSNGCDANNNNTDENNNNKQSSQDEFEEEVSNWADEPWTPCYDVDVPDWAKMEDPTTDDVNSELVWAEDPWTQEPLVGLPSWMLLPGIDFPVEATKPVEKTPVNDEDDVAFLASGIEIGNWSDEPYFQLPLDVPRWAMLPGIDYPVHRGNNSPYWKFKIQDNFIVRRQFRRDINKSKFHIIEEGNLLELARETIRAKQIAHEEFKEFPKKTNSKLTLDITSFCDGGGRGGVYILF